MVIYNIQSNGDSTQLVIELMNDTIYLEPKAIAYMIGEISLVTDKSMLHNKAVAHLIGKRYFKPAFTGTGKIYLNSTLGTYHKLTLKENDPLIISANAFIACRNNISLKPLIQCSLAKFLSGTPMVNLLATGAGNLVVHMPGPVTELIMKQDKIICYKSNVAAYTPSLVASREQVNMGWMASYYRLAQIFRGTGTIYFSPHPNKDGK